MMKPGSILLPFIFPTISDACASVYVPFFLSVVFLVGIRYFTFAANGSIGSSTNPDIDE